MNTNNIPDLIDREQFAWDLLKQGWNSSNDAQHTKAREFADALNDCHREQIAKVTAERDELRKIFPAILHACDNGSGCTESVSLEFLKEVPAEVRGVVQGLKREIVAFQTMRDEACAELAAMREAVKEVTAILAKIPGAYDSRFFRAGQWANAVIAKLQPFIK